MYLLWKNLDPSAVINNIYFLVFRLDSFHTKYELHCSSGETVSQIPVFWTTQARSLGVHPSSESSFYNNKMNQINGLSGLRSAPKA